MSAATLSDFTPAPDGTTWHVTILDSKTGLLGVKLYDKQTWNVLGVLNIMESWSRPKCQRITRELIEGISGQHDD